MSTTLGASSLAMSSARPGNTSAGVSGRAGARAVAGMVRSRKVADGSGELDADADRIAQGVGDRRPGVGMRNQVLQFFLAGVTFEVHLYPHVGEAELLQRVEITHAPHRGDVDVAFELELELGER